MHRIEELKKRFEKELSKTKMGASLDELSEDFAVVSAPVTPDMLIVEGIVQGGIITTIVDFAGVYAAMTRISSGHTPAAHIAIDFVRPIKFGEIIKAVANVTIIETRSSLWVDVIVYGNSDIKNDKIRAHAKIHFTKPKPIAAKL